MTRPSDLGGFPLSDCCSDRPTAADMSGFPSTDCCCTDAPNTDLPGLPERPVSPAVSLYARTHYWWAFEGDLLEVRGGNQWSQVSGTSTYETGVKGLQLVPDHELKQVAGGGIAVGNDWTMAFWVDVSNARAGQVGIGRGENVGGTNLRAYLALGTTTSGGSNTCRFNVSGRDSAGVVHIGTGQGISAARHFFVLRWDEAAQTLSASVDNGAQIESVVVGSSLYFDALDQLGIRGTSGYAASDSLSQHVDELSLYNGYLLTSAEEAYFYNDGVGKSYAEFVDDAT